MKIQHKLSTLVFSVFLCTTALGQHHQHSHQIHQSQQTTTLHSTHCQAHQPTLRYAPKE